MLIRRVTFYLVINIRFLKYSYDYSATATGYPATVLWLVVAGAT